MTTLPRTEDEIEIVAEVREGEYGGKLAAIEPGGAEFISRAVRRLAADAVDVGSCDGVIEVLGE